MMRETETGIPVNSSGGDMASSNRLSCSVRGIRLQGHAHSLVVAATSRESVGASKRRHRIVEGCAAASRKEFARYLDISIKSTSEVDYQLQLAHDLGAIDTATWQPLAQEVGEMRKMLWGLWRTILITPDSRDPRENNPTKRDPEA